MQRNAKRCRIETASDSATPASSQQAAWRGEYKNIDTQGKSLDLPAEIWEKINDKLLLLSQVQFAQVSRGTYALGSVMNNRSSFYNRFIRAKGEQVKALLLHVVRGEKREAEEMILTDPSLLLAKGRVKDFSGRTIEGTALGIALGAEDVGDDESQCDLVLIQPADNLDNLTAANIRSLDSIARPAFSICAAQVYIRCADQLFYLDNVNDECVEIKLDQAALKQFDAEMKPQFDNRALSKEQRQQITSITGHDHHEEMAEMIQRHLRKQFANGEEIIAAQIAEQFPEGFEEKERERAEQDLKALNDVVEAITESHQDSDCDEALIKFRNYLEPKDIIKTGKHFNVELLFHAFGIYDKKKYDTSRLYRLGRTVGNPDEKNDDFVAWESRKQDLFWQKVIGYIQRYLPACYAQAFCQGLYDKTTLRKKLRRSCKFTNNDAVFFPLDTDPHLRLGYEFATAVCLRGEGYMPGMAGGFVLSMLRQKHQRCENLRNASTITRRAGLSS